MGRNAPNKPQAAECLQRAFLKLSCRWNRFTIKGVLLAWHRLMRRRWAATEKC
jgi:hypothetical protein